VLLVANGEIYNHAELRGELKSHRFSGDSDCEVALHAFERWGVDAFERCRGMFAMAIWEQRARRLTLVRDRLGIKPLYVCHVPDGVIFASELKALLLHPACPREMDLAALELNPLSLSQTPTYVRDVDFLPAGSYLRVGQDRSLVRGKYWDIESKLGCAPFGENSSQYVDALHGLIEESVREHLQGDGSAAIHLSGGLDSAMLASIIARRTKDAPCYTIVERTAYLAGDVDSARRCANTLGLAWSPVLFDYRHVLDQLSFGLARLEESVRMMDSPHFDLEWMIKEELSHVIRVQRPDIKVVMLGQGADEFAGGYSNRIDAPRSTWSKYLSDEIKPLVRAHLPGHGVLPEALAAVGPYHGAMRLFLRQLQHHNLWHEDRSSSWQSLEARVPFLDHRIVELLASIPASLHETLFWNKQIMRRCMQRFFPEFDVQRPKVGFLATNDTRSIDIIVHGMASRAAPEFLEKYFSWPGFVFDKDEILALAQRVICREPGFYSDSYRLLSLMCAVIFKHQCEMRDAADYFRNQSLRRKAPTVAQSEWPSVRKAMMAEPIVAMVWQLRDRPAVPENSDIAVLQLPNGNVRFTLSQSGAVFSEIEMVKPPHWVSAFMRNVGRGLARSFTVQDWVEEFDLNLGSLSWLLSALHQSGFIYSANNPVVESFMKMRPERQLKFPLSADA